LVFIIWVIFKWEPVPNKIELLHITYKQKTIVISIICILVIITVWFLKKQKFYTDDLFFISMVLVIWVYAWRQNNDISGFLAKLPTQANMTSQDIILPIPGTDILSYQGLKAAPVTPSADKRSGVLPEHYDYLPDDMKRVPLTLNSKPSAPLDEWRDREFCVTPVALHWAVQTVSKLSLIAVFKFKLYSDSYSDSDSDISVCL
jgi:hypothetical protein